MDAWIVLGNKRQQTAEIDSNWSHEN